MKKNILLTTLILTIFFTPQLEAKKKIQGLPAPTPGKLNLVWQADVEGAGTNFMTLPKIEGVTVVSPCWFDIVSAHGLIRNKMKKEDKAYVAAMHEKGYKVWPLITNSFNPDMTHMLLTSPEGMANVKEYMLGLANTHGFDGFNLDFENIRDQDKQLLTAFIKDLSESLRSKNLKVSMDVTNPSDTPFWSRCYDRGALAKELDYLMVMAYDQHHPSTKIAGSTAALNWVETKLQDTMKEVPAQKLVLGLPFYSRIWETTPGSSLAKGKTISMTAMEKLILEEKITPQWKAELGQNYLEYTKEGKTYKVWQENAQSLQEKIKLVEKYNLAGIASWRKGFETEDIWAVMDSTLNNKPLPEKETPKGKQTTEPKIIIRKNAEPLKVPKTIKTPHKETFREKVNKRLNRFK